MAKKPESRLQQRIRKALEEEVGGWWVKIHGGPFQDAGIPDLIGCVEGRFFALEVKCEDGRVSSIQTVTMDKIRRKGQGVAAVVLTPEEAVDVVRQALRLSKEGS